MEINIDAYDCYVEELRYKGIPVDDHDDVDKMKWYVKYLDNLDLEEDEQEVLYNQEKDGKNLEKNFVEVTLLYQLKDDVEQLIKQLQLVTQRLERVEDQQHKDMTNKVTTH